MSYAYLDSEGRLIGYGSGDGESGAVDPAQSPIVGATYRVALMGRSDLPVDGTFYYDFARRTFDLVARRERARVAADGGSVLAAVLRAKRDGEALPDDVNEALEKLIYPMPTRKV